MAPLPIILGLAQLAPSIMRFFGVGEQNAQVAEKVVEIAQTISGTRTPEEALAALKASAELQQQFQMAILSANKELEQAYLADVQDARKRDTAIRLAGQRNYRADMLTLGAFIVICLLCWKVWSTPEVPEWVKGVVTLVLGRFLGYMDQIFQFEFGTTRRTVEAK